MRYPVEDFETKWYSAQGFGVKTDYGFHEGEDINFKSGGNTDLGQPIFALADGEVTSVHNHSTGFGKHIHIKHDGAWGTVYCHYAHCLEIFPKVGDKVKEGDRVALLGSSGNSKLAHLHFAIKLQPTGIDGIAKIEEDLKKWTPPIEFIKKWSRDTENEDINVVRKHRDRNWKMYEQEKKLREEVGRDYQALKEKANELKSQKEEYAAKLGVSDRHEDILQAIKQLKDAEDGERELKKELDGCMAEKVTIEDKLRAMESAKDNVEARESTVKTEAGMNFIPKGGVSIWQKIQTWWYRQNFR